MNTNLSGLTPDDLMLIVAVACTVLVVLCFLTIPSLWKGGTSTEVVVDHEGCVADDCDTTLCYCPGDRPCAGTTDAGCSHPAGLVCDAHRGQCWDCRLDAMDDAGLLG